MGPYLLGKWTSCWWRHETIGNIYYVEFNFLNQKCYVFKMFLPNFYRIEWKMEKQQLFQNRLFLALFILTWGKCDVIVTSLLIWFGFFHRKLFTLSESNSVQNLSSLTLKTKELWKGGGKHPPPSATTRQKSPVLIGLKADSHPWPTSTRYHNFIYARKLVISNSRYQICLVLLPCACLNIPLRHHFALHLKADFHYWLISTQYNNFIYVIKSATSLKGNVILE